ncbi:MAG TPA: DUF6600 domain-containing protein [Acidobacteriaceae bacterium]|nr:DUF6600 domain-containing protein [Acidobacteriaceae bacterium]
MKARTMVRRFAFLSALTLPFSFFGIAQAQDASAPMRAARLTSSQGTVTVTDGTNPAVPAQMNLPLPAGVQIATGDDGQAEIEFEDGSVARLTPNSALSLDRLDIAPGELFVTDLSVLRGLAYFELRATQEYVYSIHAGGDEVSPVENLTVRVNFDEPPASFAVLDGTAEVQRANSFQAEVHAGETLRDDASSPARYSLSEQIAEDSWDRWNADMDAEAAQQADDSTNVRDNYAGAQGYGWSDLDSDGTWYNVPGQGEVWQPYAAGDDADFDPYGNGSWVWYPGTGYLWASAYPWGWTPYRCGAWSYYDSFGWGWAPGATCGGYGWGFAGGGFLVNISVGPRGYRPIRVPVGRPGPTHPIIPVRMAGNPGRKFDHVMSPSERRARVIAGVTAQPVVPVHDRVVTGRTYAGGSLGRDFPIDRTTHRASMGTASTRPSNVYHMGERQQVQQTQRQQQGQTQQQQGQQQYSRPGAQSGQAPQNGQQQRQGQSQQQERQGFQGGRNYGQQRNSSQSTTQPQQNVQPQQQNSQPVYTRPQQNQSGTPGQQGNRPAFPRQPQQNAPQQGSSQPGYTRPSQNSQQQPNSPAQQSNQPSNQPTFTRPQGQNSRQQSAEPQHTAPEHPMYNGAPPPQQQRFTPPQNTQPSHMRPQQQSVPQQSVEPQHTAPAHPNFTPPQQSHPSYSPPPQPHYSAPPAPAPHMSAPPPSPPPAPHMSAPPPSTPSSPSHK